jgi:hypothetical protein
MQAVHRGMEDTNLITEECVAIHYLNSKKNGSSRLAVRMTGPR